MPAIRAHKAYFWNSFLLFKLFISLSKYWDSKVAPKESNLILHWLNLFKQTSEKLFKWASSSLVDQPVLFISAIR